MGIIQKQGIQNTIVTYLGIAVGFLSLIVVQPRFLTPEELGLTRVLFSFASLIAIFLPLGITNITIRYFPHFRDHETGHRGFFGFMLLFPLAGFIFTSLILFFFRNFFIEQYAENSALFSEYFLVVIPFSFVLGMINVFNSYSFSIYRTSFPSFLNDIIIRLLYIVVLYGYYIDLVTLNQFIGLFVFIYLVQMITLVFYIYKTDRPALKIDMPHLRKQGLKGLMIYGLTISFGSIAALGLKFLDAIMIGKFLSLSMVGIYTIAAFTPTIIEAPLNALEKITSTKTSNAIAQKNREEVEEIYYRSARYLFLIGGLFFIGINANIERLMEFLPKDYSQGITVVRIISLGTLAAMVGGVNASIIFVSEKYFFGVFLLVGLLILAFVMNLFLIPRYGIEGAAVATAFSSLLYSATRIVYIWKRFDYQPFDMNTIKIAALISVIYLANNFLPSLNNAFIDIVYRSFLLTFGYIVVTIIIRIVPELHTFIGIPETFGKKK
jgi:O-antigen/teichoic acid export membrane protein